VSLEFHITREPNVVVFSILGKINQDAIITEMMQALESELKSGNKQFVFNLNKLEFMSSTGLNFFIRCLTKIRNAGGDLVLVEVHGIVEKLFGISKLNEIFTICPTLEEGRLKITK
jgi:anti-sigma B factor antagonist